MRRGGNDEPARLAGLAAVGVGVCCGLPLLLGVGALSAAAGIVVGSALVAGIGLAVGAVEVIRRRHRQSCPSDQPTNPTATMQSGGH